MKPKDFRYRQFMPAVILQCLRWYLRYPISYRHLEEMMTERGVEVDHTNLYRWVDAYSAELAKRICYYSKPYVSSWGSVANLKNTINFNYLYTTCSRILSKNIKITTNTFKFAIELQNWPY